LESAEKQSSDQKDFSIKDDAARRWELGRAGSDRKASSEIEKSGQYIFTAGSVSSSDAESSLLAPIEWSSTDPKSLPTEKNIAKWWESGRACSNRAARTSHVVRTTALTIRRGDATLLQDLTWDVCRGDRWLVAGGNGAGKSTLSRFLACKAEELMSGGDFYVTDGDDDGCIELQPGGDRRPGIGWVSTELHMSASRSDRRVHAVVKDNGAVSDKVAVFVTRALHIDGLADRFFSELSQGEQKLVLIAAALAARPQLLILDEPCQGLDIDNRRLMLGLVERICRSTDVSLVYITHHLEELIPSVTHVLHLVGGRDVYNGKRGGYDSKIF